MTNVVPNRIPVGASTYHVVRTEDVDMLSRWGETDRNKKQLRFGTLTSPEQMRVTFLHEVLHAIWGEYGVAEGDNEERIISALSVGLARVLMDLGFWPEQIYIAGEKIGD